MHWRKKGRFCRRWSAALRCCLGAVFASWRWRQQLTQQSFAACQRYVARRWVVGAASWQAALAMAGISALRSACRWRGMPRSRLNVLIESRNFCANRSGASAACPTCDRTASAASCRSMTGRQKPSTWGSTMAFGQPMGRVVAPAELVRELAAAAWAQSPVSAGPRFDVAQESCKKIGAGVRRASLPLHCKAVCLHCTFTGKKIDWRFHETRSGITEET